MTDEFSLQEGHEKFAKSIFNGIWQLLEKTNRSTEEDEEMLMRAFASAYHWKQIGTEIHFQRAYWMISKVYQALGEANNALEWAQKCAEITQNYSGAMEDFDLAYSEEALARSYALLGDLDLAKKHHQRAAELGGKIQDPENRKIFQSDFDGGNWFGLSSGI
jgi:tetratricopeptide (TPR) repeat protein